MMYIYICKVNRKVADVHYVLDLRLEGHRHLHRKHLFQHTSAYVSIRQHTSTYVSIRQHTYADSRLEGHRHLHRQHLPILLVSRV